MATPTKDERDSEGCKLPAAAEACLAEAEEANSERVFCMVRPWGTMVVSAADWERALPLLAVLGYEEWEIAELHRDAKTLGMHVVLRHLPADVGLRPRAALVRVLGKVTPIA